MSVNALNAVMGPASIYIGAYGATEPADAAVNTTPQVSAYTDLGGTNGGTTLNVNQEFAMLSFDQIIDVVGRRQSTRDLQVVTNLAEVTLENLVYALNGGSVTTGTGFKSYSPAFTDTSINPTYRSLIVDGWAPGIAAQKRRRFILRRTLSIANVGIAYTKDGQTMYPVTWGVHFIDTNTPPFKIIDEV